MRKPFVAGNWKMYGSQKSITALLENLLAGSESITNVELAIFSPFIYLPLVSKNLSNSTINYGGQTLSEHAEGAYTGEIAADMLTDFGCSHVLVGHSERRSLFGETDDIVAKKFAAAKKSGLIPILCVGETLEQREGGETLNVIKNQINAVLSLENGAQALYNAVIAYEPVWAIGTGKTATPEQAQEVHGEIRAHIAGYDSDLSQTIQILYGGSVKRDNAGTLFAMPDIDGGLIGGASLDAEHFLDIARSCNSY